MSETSDDVNGIAANQLKQFVARIERLEEEKKAIAEDIKEVYSEVKGRGFDTKILRKVIALRKQDADDRNEEEALLDVYLRALGMKPDFSGEEETDVDLSDDGETLVKDVRPIKDERGAATA